MRSPGASHSALVYVLTIDLAAAALLLFATTWLMPPATLPAPVGSPSAPSPQPKQHNRSNASAPATAPPPTKTSTAPGSPPPLLYPPATGCLLTALTYLWVWAGILRRGTNYEPYKWTFSAATVILATTASTLFHTLTPPAFLSADPTPLALAFLAATGSAITVNAILVAAAILLTTPGATARQAFGGWATLGLELASSCLGILITTVFTTTPALIALAIPVLLVPQQALLLAEVQHAARTDPKTGLANPTWWTDQATRELHRAHRRGEGLSLLLADIDHFKHVNDTHGHLVGDMVLAEIAHTLTAAVRDYDIVSRFGGEEFVILLPATPGPEAW